MSSLPSFPLTSVADAYASHLFNPVLRERLAHHVSHVASEIWLAMELAYSFNKSKDHLGLDGWTAVLERQRVDVTLIPPPACTDPDTSTKPIYIECKMVGPPYWSVWHEIALDLEGKQYAGLRSVKPCANYAVCFLYDILPQSMPTQRADTKERYRRLFTSIPVSPGRFTPHQHEHEFILLHSSEEHLIEWAEPIPVQWPHGFAAKMRVFWIAKAPDLQNHSNAVL